MIPARFLSRQQYRVTEDLRVCLYKRSLSGWDAAPQQNICLTFTKTWFQSPVPKQTKTKTKNPTKICLKKKQSLKKTSLWSCVQDRLESTGVNEISYSNDSGDSNTLDLDGWRGGNEEWINLRGHSVIETSGYAERLDMWDERKKDY